MLKTYLEVTENLGRRKTDQTSNSLQKSTGERVTTLRRVLGKCQKLTGSPRSVNFGAKNWEEFNFEWVELGGRLKPDLETNPSGMHASPSPGRHLSTPQVELFP